MRARGVVRWMVVAAILAVVASALAGTAAAAPRGGTGRYLVVVRNAADYGAVRAKAVREGARVVHDLRQLKTIVVTAPAAARSRIAADRRTLGVAADRVISVGPPEAAKARLTQPGLRGAQRVAVRAPGRVAADPAFSYRGLLWDYRRMGLPQGWRVTTGDPDVTVAVADTGLDFTHAELGPKVTSVVDLTRTEDPPICETAFGVADEDLAAEFGGPVTTDWNGHGSWIGGNIAAALDGTGTNGIAPRVGLVSLKISQWCGAAYDSTLLAAFALAAERRIDVVNISFGGYSDLSDPEQRLIYQAYVEVVRLAKQRGTVIVAAAGNDAVRVGAGGRVLSHGSLTLPGDPVVDLFGWYQTPGGVPGVVDVSATNNAVNAPSPSCPPGTEGTPEAPNATCKPASDRHQPVAVGHKDQLAYYSNYGPRIDVAAPGGARKFNLPAWDRGGTPGFPHTTADLTNAWQTFSTTSNWAVQVACFVFGTGSGFPPGECYSTIQGTSMAAPHVAAALGLIASAHPSLRHRVDGLVARLKRQADPRHNLTPVISATDTSPGDLSGVPCQTGYCHLGGPRISDRDAYGAGIVDVRRP
jgi:subtilisin family serine protease